MRFRENLIQSITILNKTIGKGHFILTVRRENTNILFTDLCRFHFRFFQRFSKIFEKICFFHGGRFSSIIDFRFSVGEHQTLKIEVSNFSNTMNDVAEIIREQKGFETPSLNEHLYLHMKGFRKIEGLEAYVNLKTLWLQSNAIERIENLEANTELRNLFLQNNMIQRIENLSVLSKLIYLNLGGNRIQRIEGLDQLKCLSVLDASGNLLSSVKDVEHLQKCTSLTNIDLSANNLDDVNIKDLFSAKHLPSLRCLSLRKSRREQDQRTIENR